MKNLIMMCLVFISVTVFAHAPLLSVDDNKDGTIYIEAGFSNGEKAEVKEEKASNKVAKAEQDIHVTDFEGNPTKPKNEEKVEPVAEAESAKATKSEEPTPAETSQQDAELDVVAEPVDKKAFYKEFREWMGEDGVKAKKAIAVFGKHGVTRPSSDSLTDDLITDLKSIMVEKEA